MENYCGQLDRSFAALADTTRSVLAQLEQQDGQCVGQAVCDQVGHRGRASSELAFTHLRLHDETGAHGHEAGWTGVPDKLERHFIALKRGQA